MTRRKTDRTDHSVFRSDRFFQHGDQWYFATREGTDQGPFSGRQQAEERLWGYIRVMESGLDANSGELQVLPPGDLRTAPQ
ncbi:MAG: DUF6316 family protein [Halioglobus sp.]|nr:DUF6316 family protein [Halioglobus sp.]